MSSARRLNIPLSLLLALGVACGLGGAAGVARQVERVQPAATAAPLREDCQAGWVISPRIHGRSGGGCRDRGLAERFGKARLP
jgi:hypothetical protein